MNVKEDAQRVFDEIEKGGMVYTFGNGGSCSIANHMETDWTKNSKGRWVVESLCSNSSMITMIANDYGYEHICSQQLSWKNDNPYEYSILVLVSSSGNSKSVIYAAETDKELGMCVIGFTGFDGGNLKPLCDISVHIDTDDYGVAEDYHSNVMHEIARMLRANK